MVSSYGAGFSGVDAQRCLGGGGLLCLLEDLLHLQSLPLLLLLLPRLRLGWGPNQKPVKRPLGRNATDNYRLFSEEALFKPLFILEEALFRPLFILEEALFRPPRKNKRTFFDHFFESRFFGGAVLTAP